MRPRRLLIVSTAFHDYDRAIAAAFATLGHDATTHLYDRSATVSAKLRTKLRHELPERWGRDTTAARARHASEGVVAALRQVRPDLVLVVKGDVLDDDVWDALEQARIPSVLWLYDELRRTRWDAERLRRPRRVASYSRLDVEHLRDQGLDAEHVALGFDHLLTVPERPASDEVTFIGARYPRREDALTGLAARGVPVRAYGRDWSHDLRDRARTWGGARPALPAGRDLSRPDAYAVMRSGRATWNLHGDQDGFTMRTFEAAGVGAVQLCDRGDVSALYEPGREVLVASTPEEAADAAGMLARDPRRARDLRDRARARTFAQHTLAHRAAALAALWE